MHQLCQLESVAPGLYRCSRCGWETRLPKSTRRNCDAFISPLPIEGGAELPATSRERRTVPLGLGDHVSLILDAAGITPARVTWFLRAAKIIEADASCGCDERKARLNRIGARLLRWARRHQA